MEGDRHRLLVATHGPIHLVEVDGVAHRISRDEGGVVRSPAPALVVATPVGAGDEVAAGEAVVVLESMKMETALVAPFAARIREVLVKPGTQVEGLAPLLRLEPVGETHDETAAPGLDLPAPRDLDAATAWREALADLNGAVLGFDAGPGLLDRYLSARDAYAAAGGDVLSGECDLLSAFSDIAELGRNRPAGEQARTGLRIHSDREYLHSFLTTLDADRASLPTTFVHRLTRALGHYGIAGLERSPQLEDAVFRVFLAQQNSRDTLGLVLGVLERWLTEPAPGG